MCGWRPSKRVQVLGTGLISAGLVFPLNEGGVKAGLTPVVGFEYTFGKKIAGRRQPAPRSLRYLIYHPPLADEIEIERRLHVRYHLRATASLDSITQCARGGRGVSTQPDHRFADQFDLQGPRRRKRFLERFCFDVVETEYPPHTIDAQ